MMIAKFTNIFDVIILKSIIFIAYQWCSPINERTYTTL